MRSQANVLRLHQRDDILHEIVERTIVETRERLGADLKGMTCAELRGYVKARATAPALTQVQRLIAERRVFEDCRAVLIEQLTERVTQSIVRDVMHAPIVSLPFAAVPMRAAA